MARSLGSGRASVPKGGGKTAGIGKGKAIAAPYTGGKSGTISQAKGAPFSEGK